MKLRRWLLTTFITASSIVFMTNIHKLLSVPGPVTEPSEFFPFLEESKDALIKAGFPRSSCDCNSRQSTDPVDSWNGRIFGFFNIYKKNEASSFFRFNRIVSEQLTALDESGLTAASSAINVVYFGPQPDRYQINSTSPQHILSPNSNATGNEETTLQLLHDHCTAHPNDRVFYIHSKGTFHPSDANDRLRRSHMAAIVACWRLDGLAISDVCGLRASPLPHPHLTGNMWWARCAHIARLPRPAAFGHSMNRVHAASFAIRSGGNASRCPDPFVGAGRFAPVLVFFFVQQYDIT
jgi:hypothetical protein